MALYININTIINNTIVLPERYPKKERKEKKQI